MANCADNIYVIYYTNISDGIISVLRSSLVVDVVDISLIGKVRLEYGEVFNENCLHLLEHFSAPSIDGQTPDLNSAYGNVLLQPTRGQLWFNSTDNRPYQYSGIDWLTLGMWGDVRGNSGVIAHGEQLPRPIDPTSGYEYTYDECAWIVSPFHYPDSISYMQCTTDSSSAVTMEFIIDGESELQFGNVNYQIIAILGNVNLGSTDVPVSISLASPYELEPLSYTPQDIIIDFPNTIHMECALNDKDHLDIGYTENIYSDCQLFDCSPKLDVSLMISSDSPYTIKITDIIGTESLEDNLFFINHIGPITKNDFILYSGRTEDVTILSFRGNCGITPITANGMFTIAVENLYGKSISKTVQWSFIRIDKA